MRESLKTIRSRIRGTGKVLKVTQALERMSAARVVRVRMALKALAPYAAGLAEAARVVARAAGEGAAGARGRGGGDAAVVVFGANRGLCGGFTARLAAAVEAVRAREGHGRVSVIAVGRAVWGRLADGEGWAVRREVQPSLAEAPGVLGALFDELYGQVRSGRLARVVVVHGVCASAWEQDVCVANLLPVSFEDMDRLAGVGRGDGGEPLGFDAMVSVAEFEPAAADLLEGVMREAASVFFSEAYLHSAAAEHAARQAVMRRANDSASRLMEELMRRYNRLRQESITTQVLEIAAGMGRHG